MNAALERLRERRTMTAGARNAATSDQEAQTREPTPLTGITIEGFANSGRVLRIYSQVLNEEVLLAADNAVLSEDETRTVYRAGELLELLDITPEGLRLLHEIKTMFPDSAILPDAASNPLPSTVTTASNNILAD